MKTLANDGEERKKEERVRETGNQGGGMFRYE